MYETPKRSGKDLPDVDSKNVEEDDNHHRNDDIYETAIQTVDKRKLSDLVDDEDESRSETLSIKYDTDLIGTEDEGSFYTCLARY